MGPYLISPGWLQYVQIKVLISQELCGYVYEKWIEFRVK